MLLSHVQKKQYLTNIKEELRVRIFAGPNGSGKSTIIQNVRQYVVAGFPVDFGIYINADDIAKKLREGIFDFTEYNLDVANKDFQEIALSSGLISPKFTYERFTSSYILRKNCIKLKDVSTDERLAQILADYLRKKLLEKKVKFSFETVFSHESKIDIMRECADAGYKVYLYFVSTKSPEINKYRVSLRKQKGGHDVPPDVIESRYYRSLDLLFDAAQVCYQAYFFDNSGDKPILFAHFKRVQDKKKWDEIDEKIVPNWFVKYYSNKIK